MSGPICGHIGPRDQRHSDPPVTLTRTARFCDCAYFSRHETWIRCEPCQEVHDADGDPDTCLCTPCAMARAPLAPNWEDVND